MTNDELDELLAVLAKYGVLKATFDGLSLASLEFPSPSPPPLVVTPGDNEADLPPGPVDAAAIALAGRRRAERKSEAE